MIELNRIYTEDCLETMSRIPTGAVDIINTDPPYNVGKFYEGKGGEYSNDDNMPEADFWKYYTARAEEMSRVLKDRGFLYVSSATKQIFKVREIYERAGLKWVQILIWYGPNMLGFTPKCAMPWTQLMEPITLFIKGKRQPMNDRVGDMLSHDVQVHSRPQRNSKAGRFHPCQKPLKLYEVIIARTPGEIIYDPFMGVGTTAIAAVRQGRQWIGSEIRENFAEIARTRVRNEVAIQRLVFTQEELYPQA